MRCAITTRSLIVGGRPCAARVRCTHARTLSGSNSTGRGRRDFIDPENTRALSSLADDASWPPPESHRLQPDHHPTPFSAAQIHDAFVLGRIVRSVVTRRGGDAVVRVTKNLAADD